ncbi:methyltransferase domain-containing protein, partial [bacterium]|nr:methyltransferase domain-containing protein [bacterium]
MRLNLGCGTDIIPGFINLDIVKLDGVDVVHDLSKYPYPFEENTFDEIVAIDVIEHLPSTVQVIEELYRISSPNAKI